MFLGAVGLVEEVLEFVDFGVKTVVSLSIWPPHSLINIGMGGAKRLSIGETNLRVTGRKPVL